jgi:hypothetical protein
METDMSEQAYADRLQNALNRTGCIETVEAKFGPDRVNVLFRVKAGLDNKVLEVVKNVLVATEYNTKYAHRWNTHACRVYALKEIKGERKLVYGWNLSIISNDMGNSLDVIIKVIQGANPEPQISEEHPEFEDIPLIGAPPERNAPGENGRGAHTIGGKAGNFRPPVRNSRS